MLKPSLAAAVAALFLLVASPAGAAPFSVGEGKVPAVAVDDGGNGYIAWNGNEIPSSLNFCRVPRGATACDQRLTLPTQGDSLTRPFVQVEGGEVVRVLSYRYGLTGARFDGVFLFTSTDRGVTFGPGVMVGDVPIYDAVSGPGAGISLVTSAVTQGEFFQRVPTDGSSVVGQSALLSTTHPYLGTVALTDSATPLVVFDDGFSNAQWRRFTGTGNVNDAGSWTPAQDIGYADYPHLAGGPSGVLMLAAGQDRQLHVRRYLGDTGFGAARPIPGATGEAAQDYMTQDSGGRLHVLLPQITANGSRLFYGTSDDGVSWARRQFAFEPLAQQVRAAATVDHTGLAVWQSASNPSTINAMELVPGPELGRTVGVRAVRGRVFVGLRSATIRGGRAAGGGRFRTRIVYERLRGQRTIPVGSFLNTKRGTVRLTSATGRGARTQSGQFSSGLFQVLQSRKRSAKGLTELRLKGGSFGKCGARGGRAAAAQLSRRTIRRVRANARGRFRTRGRGSAATVRGTVWTMSDRCDGTLTAVKRGRVAVRDFRRKRTIVVRAGKSYLARVR